MAGLLGSIVAGAAKGYADQQIKNNAAQQEFNLKQALLQAEEEMRQRLDEAGLKVRQRMAEEDRAKVKGILDSQQDPNADKGGWESPEMKAKSARALKERQRDALRNNARFDEAKAIDDELSREDTLAAKEAMLNSKEKFNTLKYELDKRELESDMKLKEAQGQATIAKAEAAAAKGSKDSPLKEEYKSYAEDVRTNGRKTASGGMSKLPMAYDKWVQWRLDTDAKRKQKADTTRREVEYGPDGKEVLSIKETTTGKPSAKTEKVKTYVPGKGYVD